MDELKKTTNEIEHYIFSKRKLLLSAKISFILFILGGIGQEYVKTLGYREKYKMSWLEWNSTQLLLILAVLVPILLIPLHKFIKDKLMNHYIWNIKHSIFEKVLNQYDTTYQIAFNGCLPEIDIKRLDLEKGWVSFIYGDDLIVGTINDVKFRLSEMHSNGFIKRFFNGIIVVLVFDHLIESEKIENLKLPENTAAKVFENKVYLLIEGKKKHFELKIKKTQTNEEELIDDYNYFKKIVDFVNKVSLDL